MSSGTRGRKLNDFQRLFELFDDNFSILVPGRGYNSLSNLGHGRYIVFAKKKPGQNFELYRYSSLSFAGEVVYSSREYMCIVALSVYMWKKNTSFS